MGRAAPFGVAVCLLVVAHAVFALPPSLTPLGDDKYTIHADGRLDDVLKQLLQLTGWVVTQPGAGSLLWTKYAEMRVKLDFEQATLQQILLELCGQAGLVYSVSDAGRGKGAHQPPCGRYLG